MTSREKEAQSGLQTIERVMQNCDQQKNTVDYLLQCSEAKFSQHDKFLRWSHWLSDRLSVQPVNGYCENSASEICSR